MKQMAIAALIVVALVTAVPWGATAFAQTPNFAGAWLLDPASATREKVTIKQDAKTITVTPWPRGLPATYNLDGSDSKNEISLGVDVVSNVKWDGAKLVVTTHTQQGDQVTSYYMEGADLVVERRVANATFKTHYVKGRG